MTENNEINLREKLHDRMNKLNKIRSDKRIRKPMIIEFCGSPKSGKTTCIKQLEAFFNYHGYKVYSLVEKASISPISNKHSPDFNMYTLLSTLNDLIYISKMKKYEIILIDRGIFDSLCWFRWHKEQDNLDEKSYESIKDFALLKRWVRITDIIFVFKLDPKYSMERNKKHILITSNGSVINDDSLSIYNKSIDLCVREFGKLFTKIVLIDANVMNPLELIEKVSTVAIDELIGICKEKIGYFDKSFSKKLNYGINKNLQEIENLDIQFNDRAKVEKSFNVQIIPIAIVMNKTMDKIYVVKKQEKALKNNSPEKDKFLLWIGGHIRFEDQNNTYKTFDIIQNALTREIEEEIGIDYTIKSNLEKFIIYTPSSQKSKRHMAICYVIKINEFISIETDNYELMNMYGNSKYGKFYHVKEIKKHFKIEEFEEWSQEIGYRLNIWQSKQENFLRTKIDSE